MQQRRDSRPSRSSSSTSRPRNDRSSGPKREYKSEGKREYGSGPKREYKSDGKREYGSGPKREFKSEGKREYGSGPKREYKSEGKREYSSGPKREYSSEGKREYGSGPKREYKSEGKREYGSGPKREYGSGPKREYKSEGKREYGSGPKREYGSGPKREYGSGPKREYGSGPKREYGSGPKREYSSEGKREYGSGPKREYKSEGKREYGAGPKREYKSEGKREYDRSARSEQAPTVERARKMVSRGRAAEKAMQGIELPPDEQRLNKAIADAGVASRRGADEMIAGGRVRINGNIVTELGTRIGIDDMVTVDGEPITRAKHLTYVLLNKPKDIITTASDEKGRSTVFDIVRIHTRLFTVGRLDRNTTGLLLLTNDGDLAHRLMHPSYEIPRVYRARLDKALKPVDAKQISQGVELEDGMTSPCEVMIDLRDNHVAHIALHEGRNREVRRLFEALGYTVKSLDRKQYAFLTIRGMTRGEYRHLTKDEILELRKLVKLT